MQPGSNSKPTEPTVEAALERLATAPIVDLRVRYRDLFRSEPPKAFGPDLLRRSIAQLIQEKAYGGLPREIQRLLDQMVKTMATKPQGRLELPRRIKPGSELVRTWKGQSHRVMVLQTGFAYGGETFSSLSEIAFQITGTKWNGPRFFGLRTATKANVKPAADSERTPEKSIGLPTSPKGAGTNRLRGAPAPYVEDPHGSYQGKSNLTGGRHGS
jgi:hypothetical protein